MESMSGGGFNYNRFDAYEAKLAESKKSDKDYDGDGKVESSKDEYFGSKDKAIKKAMGKGTCKKCEESKDDCECDDKKDVKEGMQAQENETDAWEAETGGDGSAADFAAWKKKRAAKKTVKEGSSYGYQEGGEVKAKKKKVVKEDVINHLIDEGYANNEVSADILFTHMSDEFLESIEDDIMEGFQPLPKSKMERQSNKAYAKEVVAAHHGKEKEANKQMQRRIAMQDPKGRKAQLMK